MRWSQTSKQATNKKINKLLESPVRPNENIFFFLQDSPRIEMSCCKDSEWALREKLLGGCTDKSLNVGSI